MATPPQHLSPEQVRSLFNILTHHGTYAEIETLKEPLAWPRFGFPFSDRTPGSSAALDSSLAQLSLQPNRGKTREGEASVPVLQTLLVQFVLPLPAIRDFPRDWWRVRALSIVSRLAVADLSESYDRGSIGLRKTLTTASSSVLEMVARGSLGGLARGPTPQLRAYDRGRADELVRSWDDLLQNIVYGEGFVDKFFDHLARTPNLDSFQPGTPAVTDYIVMHLAGLLHQIVVRSPEGPSLLKQLETVQTLIPWTVIRQTLRVGNAASMINAMLKIVLAKMSSSSGNLLQKIISLVMAGDASDFRKAAAKIEKAKGRPDDQHLRILREHVAAGRQAHEEAREASMRNSQSIVMAILARDTNRPASLSASQHAQCLEYYSALLAVRDRDAISNSLCRETPDHLTQAVRDAVGAYTPMIRLVHERLDLRVHMTALENFIDDFIKAGKPSKKGAPPSVEDYVVLLHKHRGFLYRFLHQVAAASPEVWDWFRAWANTAVTRFRRPEDPAADMDARLRRLFADLAAPARTSVLGAVDAHARYLAELDRLSHSRLQAVASGAARDTGVPGAYMARWQGLLDDTLITPDKPRGPVRRGREVKNAPTLGKAAKSSAPSYSPGPDSQLPAAPDVSGVVRALGDGFGRLVRERAIALQAQVDLP